jgi:predicted acyltransferase
MVNLIEAGYMAIAFVVFVVSVSIGGAVLASVQTGQTANSVAYNATGSGLTGIANLATQSGTIGTILGAVIIIGLLMGAFMMGKRE